jgi:hypothetical protein
MGGEGGWEGEWEGRGRGYRIGQSRCLDSSSSAVLPPELAGIGKKWSA